MNALTSPRLEVPTFEIEHVVVLDAETFYDLDFTLKKLSTSGYILDPRFELIGMGVDDGEQTAWLEEAEFREWAETVPWEKTAVVLHHAHFDALILSHHYDVHPAFIFDTMSMARTFNIDGGVSLQNLAERFGVGHKGNEVLQAKGKRRKDFTQEEWLRYGEYCLGDVALTKAIFYKMEPMFPEAESWLVDSTVKMFTEPKLVLDEPLLTEYLFDERKRKQEMLEKLSDSPKELRSTLMSNEKFAKLLIELGEIPPRKISPTTKKETWAFARTDPGMQTLLEHHDDVVRWVAEARVATKSTIELTRTERLLKLGEGGAAMPVYLAYAKAHTYRWAGADKTNFQNLGRVDSRKPRSGMLKKSILAPPGHVVVAADSGAIEARVNAWMAGHEDLVEMLRKNQDIYSSFASEVYGRNVDRKRTKDHPQFHPDDESAGGLGKVAQLALGYQMGWPKFATTLLAGPMGAAPIQFTDKDVREMDVNVDKFQNSEWKVERMEGIISRLDKDALLIHCAVADTIVTKYRTVNKAIVDLWGTMEQVIETMDEVGPGEEFSFGAANCLKAVRHGIRLPNGLTLHYPGLRQSEEGGYSYLSQYGKQRQHLYGGLATENVIQALARIIIGEQMLSVKAKYGYDTVLCTHDEIVVVVPEAEGFLAKTRLIEEMKIAPSWAPGLPLTASGGFNKSLGYAKS